MKKESRNNVYELMFGLQILNRTKMTDKHSLGFHYTLWAKYKKENEIDMYYILPKSAEDRITLNNKWKIKNNMKKYWKNNIYETPFSGFYFVFLDKKKMTDKSLMGREYKLWNKYKKVFSIFDYFSEDYTEERRIMNNEKKNKINKKR